MYFEPRRLAAALGVYLVVLGIGIIGIVIAHATRPAPSVAERGRPEHFRDSVLNLVMLIAGALSVSLGVPWLVR